ncbi:MAG TPA: hypothetical protein GYA10_17525 [Alphaproteobacteria bacterium]|nr:hypothetical protein [Alphaproteobacteria bacterium]
MKLRGLVANILGLLAIVMAVPALPAAAQAPGEACAAILDDVERLACYDAIFRNAGTVPSDDVIIESERLIPAQPTGRAPATMIISCDAEGLRVSFAFAGQLVSNTGDIAPVTFQVDQNATIVRTLRASADNRSLSFAAGTESLAFLDSLAGGTNLRVRMTPVRQRSLAVDFRLPERAAEIGALRESCR